jgi:hypothetical protein
MRVHRTMCSGHRPRSSPRPMAAPAARHRPARAQRAESPTGLRLRAAPSRDPAPRAPGRGAGQMWRPLAGEEEAPGGRGELRRRLAAAERVRARGCRRAGRASDSLNSTPRWGEQETPRQQLGRTSCRTARAFSLMGSKPSPSPSCQSRPLDRPLPGLCKLALLSPPSHATQEVLAPSTYSGVTKCTHFAK